MVCHATLVFGKLQQCTILPQIYTIHSHGHDSVSIHLPGPPPHSAVARAEQLGVEECAHTVCSARGPLMWGREGGRGGDKMGGGCVGGL